MENHVTLFGPLDIAPDFSKSELLNYSAIFIDGGLKYRTLHQGVELFSIGDADSNDGETLTYQYPSDKTETDYCLALKKFHSQNNTAIHFHLLALYGERIDHFLAILGDTHQFLMAAPQCLFSLYDRTGEKVLTMASKNYTGNFNGTLSLLTLQEQEVSITGKAKYLGNYRLKPFSGQGVSNIINGEYSIKSEFPFALCFNK